MLFAVNTLSYSLILDFPEFSELSKMEKIVLKDLMKIPKLLWPMSAIPLKLLQK